MTNLEGGRPKKLYQGLYCARGQAKNHIKAWKNHLAADRTSCHQAEANQFRLFLHAGAYWLLWPLRRVMPKRSAWRVMQFRQPRFRESVRLAEQNLYARARDLVGDRNPREHEFVVQLRSFDSGKSGGNLGVAVLIALCSVLLGRSLKGGLAIVGGLNLGGSVELIHNPIEVMGLAMEKGAGMILLPVSSRRALVDLSDDAATRV